MERIAKSEQFRQALEEFLLEGKPEGISHPLDTFIRLGARYMLQVALEREVFEFLGRGHYCRGRRIRDGHRNGYEPRNFRSANGILQVAIPQLRDMEEKFSSRLLKRLKKGSDVLERLVREMYVRGLSCGDVENTFSGIFGRQIISRSGVSTITEKLAEEFNAWRKRDLSNLKVVYLFLDGTYLAMRQGTDEKEGVLCAYGITEDGKKILIHIAMGERESHSTWLSFIHDMKERGLNDPLLVIIDGNPGLKRAAREAFPKSLRQRCQVHKMRNILSKLPKDAIDEIKPLIRAVFTAKGYEEGLKKGQALIKRFRDIYPSAMECLEKDLEECLTCLKFPVQHHRYIRTTNLLERTFGESKRRTKVVGRFPTEKSCLKLMFAVLIRASATWRGMRMHPAIIRDLDAIRQQIFGPDENVVSQREQTIARCA